MYFSFRGINHHEKLTLYYRNEFVHIGQRNCENRLALMYFDSHIQKKEVEVDGCHPFSGILSSVSFEQDFVEAFRPIVYFS